MSDLISLKAQRDNFTKQIATIPAGTAEYNAMRDQISNLTYDIHRQEKEREDKETKKPGDSSSSGKDYNSIYTDTSKGTKEEIAARMERIHTGKATPEDDKWRADLMRVPMDGPNAKEGLNTVQLEAATGLRIYEGPEQLKKVLSENDGNPPLIFGYVIQREKESHVVSCRVSKDKDGKTEFSFVDSNGDLIPPKEAGVLDKFPNINVVYRNKEGSKISADEAVRNPDNIFRAQYDNYNCGIYTINTLNMMKSAEKAGSSEEVDKAIADGLVNKVKNINPAQERVRLTKELAVKADEICPRAQQETKGKEEPAKTSTEQLSPEMMVAQLAATVVVETVMAAAAMVNLIASVLRSTNNNDRSNNRSEEASPSVDASATDKDQITNRAAQSCATEAAKGRPERNPNKQIAVE